MGGLVVGLASIVYLACYLRLTSALFEVPVALVGQLQNNRNLEVLIATRDFSRVLIFLATLAVPFSWVAGTIYVYALSVLLGDIDVQARNLFALFGESNFPFLFLMTIALAIAIPWSFQGEILTPLDAESLEEYVRSFHRAPTVIVIQDLEIIGTIWVYILWVLALRACTRMPLWKAIAIVGSWAALLLGIKALGRALFP